MTNVIAMRKIVSMDRPSLRIVEPLHTEKINFNMLKWFRKIYENYCKHQDDIRRKKIEELKDAAYNFYLDMYLTNTKGTVDICEALYRKGIAICSFAKDMAEMQVMIAVNEGRLEKSYKLLRKMKRDKYAAMKSKK